MPVTANILIIDDDESMRLGCVETLNQNGFRARGAGNGAGGLQLAREESFDVAIVALRMPGMSGMEVLAKLKEENPSIAVVVMTRYATIESAVEAIRQGAFDYLPKPFSPDLLVTVVKRALDRKQLALENMCLRMALKEKLGPDTIIGDSPPMANVAKLIQKVAPTDATVLVIGETGVGKELVARAVHHQSYRRDKPFVAVDCAALVENLFESELFGHVRGAFTGAVATTVGKFELANNGTLFFDEIGNIGPEMQVKLLRAIQEQEFMRVGGSQRIKVNVRIIAATNTDLLRDMKAGHFREDLFYRLSVVPIQIPPLRERREDIRVLAHHFLRKFSAKRNRDVTGFSDEALQAMEAYEWPGNVRELENTVERALVMAEKKIIEPGDLFFYGYGSVQPASPEAPAEGHLVEMEKREISMALQRFHWQVGKAAYYLGINRKTLRDKIRKYGLSELQ
jgi:DNA-binding NtrC family response regulator